MNLNIPTISHDCSTCWGAEAKLIARPSAHINNCDECKRKYIELSSDPKFAERFKANIVWALFFIHVKEIALFAREAVPYSSATMKLDFHVEELNKIIAEMEALCTGMGGLKLNLLIDIVLHMLPKAAK